VQNFLKSRFIQSACSYISNPDISDNRINKNTVKNKIFAEIPDDFSENHIEINYLQKSDVRAETDAIYL